MANAPVLMHTAGPPVAGAPAASEDAVVAGGGRGRGWRLADGVVLVCALVATVVGCYRCRSGHGAELPSPVAGVKRWAGNAMSTNGRNVYLEEFGDGAGGGGQYWSDRSNDPWAAS